MKIKELFSDNNPERWIQGKYCVDKNGRYTSPISKEAIGWCLMGAIPKCYTDYRDHTWILAKIHDRIKPFNSVSIWNDAPERTFGEVKELVEELDI